MKRKDCKTFLNINFGKENVEEFTHIKENYKRMSRLKFNISGSIAWNLM